MAKKEKIKDPKEEKRIRRANMVLEQLDGILQSMIDEIVIQKDEEVSATGNNNIIVDGSSTNKFIRKINSLKIDGNEAILIAISDRYDQAIKALKLAIKEDDESYKTQFENELNKILSNKEEKFDFIADTYRELSERLEKGKTQEEYFQNKADEKEAEMTIKDEYYNEKFGNIDRIVVNLQPFVKTLEEKNKYKEMYINLLDLNKKIKDIEDELPNLEENDKPEYEQKLLELKEKRKKEAEKFEKVAMDKDGKNYKREKEQTDEEYIKAIDAIKIDQAESDALNKLKNQLAKMSDTVYVRINSNLKPDTAITDVKNTSINSLEDVNKMLTDLKIQKELWKDKVEKDGYNKSQLKKEQQEYQEKANVYREGYDYKAEDYPVVQKKFDWRHPIRSIKNLFIRNKKEKLNNSEFDMNETKKGALKYIEENPDEYIRVNNQRNKNKYLSGLRYNVIVTEKAVEDFWNKSKTKENSDKGER